MVRPESNHSNTAAELWWLKLWPDLECDGKDLYQLALEIATMMIAVIDMDMVECPKELDLQLWPCVKEGCQREQIAACWKDFSLKQAAILKGKGGNDSGA